MRKLLIALLFTPILALAHSGHAIVDYEELFNTRIQCDRSLPAPEGCGGGTAGAGAFGLAYFIETYCGGDPKCRALVADRGYLIHLRGTGSGQARHYHVTIYIETTFPGSAMQDREVSLHDVAGPFFDADVNQDPGECRIRWL